MTRLEDMPPNATVRLLPDSFVTVVSLQWFGSEALELTYKTAAGRQLEMEIFQCTGIPSGFSDRTLSEEDVEDLHFRWVTQWGDDNIATPHAYL